MAWFHWRKELDTAGSLPINRMFFRPSLLRVLSLSVTAVISVAVYVGVAIGGSPDRTGAAAKSHGYGVIVGKVGPCPPSVFSMPNVPPLIIVLIHNGVTFGSFDISSDRLTNYYHFDVPVGTYKLVSTYNGSELKSVSVGFAQTRTVNFSVRCPRP